MRGVRRRRLLGAGGARLNLRAGNVRDFNADGGGIRQAMALTSDAVTTLRSRGREERAAKRDTLFDETDRR